MIIEILFWVFASVLAISALGMITVKNPVHAALLLVLCFFTSASIWLLIEAEFLAVVLILVYVGAVMVLFLFVVMMLDVDVGSLRAGFWRHFPVAAFVGVVIALEMAATIAMRRSTAASSKEYTYSVYSTRPSSAVLL